MEGLWKEVGKGFLISGIAREVLGRPAGSEALPPHSKKVGNEFLALKDSVYNAVDSEILSLAKAWQTVVV